MIADAITRILRYDPTYRNRIIGASDSDISHFESIVGFRLPNCYREFLSLLGNNNGGLALFGDARCDIHSILTAYGEEIDGGHADELPRGFVMVAVDGPKDGFGFVELGNPDDGSVYDGEDLEPSTRIADSFQKLLSRTVFLDFQQPSFPHWIAFLSKSKDAVIERLLEYLCDIGFKQEWFSDSIMTCAQRADLSVACQQTEISGNFCWLKLAGNSLDDVNAVGKEIRQRFRLKQIAQS